MSRESETHVKFIIEDCLIISYCPAQAPVKEVLGRCCCLHFQTSDGQDRNYNIILARMKSPIAPDARFRETGWNTAVLVLVLWTNFVVVMVVRAAADPAR